MNLEFEQISQKNIWKFHIYQKYGKVRIKMKLINSNLLKCYGDCQINTGMKISPVLSVL